MVSVKALLITYAAFAAAYPEPTANLDKRTNCAKITGALSCLKKIGPPATSFCSSYLKIPKTGTTTTTTTPVTTVTTSTSTVTVTSAACSNPGPDIQKRHSPRGYRGFHFTEPDGAPIEDIEKRTDLLPLLAAFAAAKVSEGCSCLSISPKATTTITRAAPLSTSKVIATTTTCTQVCRVNDWSCTNAAQCCSGSCNGPIGLPDRVCGPLPAEYTG